MVPIILSTTKAFVKDPDTFKHVRPMSINGSIARIGLMEVKYAPRPVPLRDTDAAIVAVPGTPAIPTEPIAITITLMIYIVISNGILATLEMYTTTSAGNTPAQPCMPAVVPKEATVLAVVADVYKRQPYKSTHNPEDIIKPRYMEVEPFFIYIIG